MTDYAKEVAQDLLEVGAVKFSPGQPFTWASGIKSPIYTDNRITIAYPAIRSRIAQGLASLITDQYGDVDVIGGVATAGIPHAAWVAERLDKPMAYLRSKPKDHGAGRQIEGAEVSGQKVVLIDDLISTGGSVLGAVDAARQAGANVVGVAAIFSYELSAADDNFAHAQVGLAALTNYSQLMAQAVENGDLDQEQVQACMIGG